MIVLLLALLLTLPSHAPRPLGDKELKRLAGRADIVVVAEVKEVEPTSELQPWSGLISSWQFVRYKVREVLKGEMSEGEVRVGFILVPGSLTADKSRPGLSPELFKPQNVHILFLERDRQPPVLGARYTGVSQDYGSITATPTVQKKIRSMITHTGRSLMIGGHRTSTSSR